MFSFIDQINLTKKTSNLTLQQSFEAKMSLSNKNQTKNDQILAPKPSPTVEFIQKEIRERAESTTIHAIPHIVKSKHWIVKIALTICFLASAGFCIRFSILEFENNTSRSFVKPLQRLFSFNFTIASSASPIRSIQ